MRERKAKAAVRERSIGLLIPLSFLLALSALALGGCNTVAGMGEDISAGGRAIDQTAETTQDKLTGKKEHQEEYQSGAY